MPPSLFQGSFPAGIYRRKDAIKIYAGPDTSDIRGLNSPFGLPTTAPVSQSASSNLVQIGSARGIDHTGKRAGEVRHAFNSDPTQGFQTVVFAQDVVIALEWISLRMPEAAELAFNFFPDSLLEQQYPFAISVNEPGDPATAATTGKLRLYLGCYFVQERVKFDLDARNQALIPEATILVSRYLVVNNAKGSGLSSLSVSSIAGAIAATAPAQTLIQNLGLS